MPQIDVILKYASRAAALADLVAQTNIDNQNVRDFLSDRAIPNLQVWRASQDVAGTDADGNPTVTHNYLSGFFVLISLPRVVPALRDDAAVQVVIDRDKANAREAGAILKSTVGAAVLQDLRFSPVFAGADYPFGAWT